jgi:cobalt/nickel transport protein
MDLKKRLWIGILVLALLSPVGVVLPLVFDAGDAWGEWSVETIQKLIGFVPEKLKANADLWKAPIPDYNLGNEESPLHVQILSYIFSGIIGVAIIAGLMYAVKKINKIKD